MMRPIHLHLQLRNSLAWVVFFSWSAPQVRLSCLSKRSKVRHEHIRLICCAVHTMWKWPIFKWCAWEHDVTNIGCPPHVHVCLNCLAEGCCCHPRLIRAQAPYHPTKTIQQRRKKRIPLVVAFPEETLGHPPSIALPCSIYVRLGYHRRTASQLLVWIGSQQSPSCILTVPWYHWRPSGCIFVERVVKILRIDRRRMTDGRIIGSSSDSAEETFLLVRGFCIPFANRITSRRLVFY